MEKHPYGIYVPPPKLTRSQILQEFASGDPERIMSALCSACFTEPASRVEDWCFKFITHSDPGVRARAIATLGELATFHGGEIDFERAITAAKQLLADHAIVIPPRVEVAGYADDALGDLRHAKKLAKRRQT